MNPTSTEAAALDALRRHIRECCGKDKDKGNELCYTCRNDQSILDAYDASLRAHDNAASEQPACPKCGAGLLVECVACSHSTFPEQPADTGVGPVAYGWLIENGKEVSSGLLYRTMRQGMPAWTNDHLEALRFCRREDAERFAQEDEDAWRIVEHGWHTAPPAIPHADQDKARNARSVGTGVVTDADVERACRAWVGPGRWHMIGEHDRRDMRAALESFAAHHAAKGARPQTSGEAGDALDAARYRWLREGDNDDACLRHLPNDRGTHWLLRREQLDAAIDAARSLAGEGEKGKGANSRGGED